MALDYKEFTALAIEGLSNTHGRRVARALDIAIIFGALERANGNESLQNVEKLAEHAEEKMRILRRGY